MPEPETLADAPSPQPPRSPNAPRILKVDDKLLIARLIEDIVRDLGYSALGIASTVATALKPQQLRLPSRRFRNAIRCDAVRIQPERLTKF
jgi:CheY-like chemotaxis protein